MRATLCACLMTLLLLPQGCGGEFHTSDDGGSSAEDGGGSGGDGGDGGDGGGSTGGRSSTGGRPATGGSGGAVVVSDSGTPVEAGGEPGDSGGSGGMDAGSPCGLTLNAVSHTSGANLPELSAPHTVAGLNRLLLVALAVRHDDGSGMPNGIPMTLAVTYGDTHLTQLSGATDGYYQSAQIWALVAPEVGQRQVTVSFSALPQQAALGVMSFTGAAQSSTFGDVAATAGIGATVTLPVPSAGYTAVVDVLSHSTLYQWTASSNQAELWHESTAAMHGYSSYTPAAGQLTNVSWSGPANGNYVLLGAPIAEVPCPQGTAPP